MLDHIFRIFPVKRFLWKEISKRRNLQTQNEYQDRKDKPYDDKFATLNSIADVSYSSATKQRLQTKTPQSPNSKLLFGTPVIPGEFPWLASLEWDGDHICPATIITRLHAITAATCLDKPLEYQDMTRLKLVVHVGWTIY